MPPHAAPSLPEPRPASSEAAAAGPTPPASAPGHAPVDLRVLQANERTLLAWVRTSLALLGFGFAIAKLGAAAGGLEAATSLWLAGGFLAVGIATNVFAALRYFAIRRALEAARPPPRDQLHVAVLVAFVTLLGLALAAWLLAG